MSIAVTRRAALTGLAALAAGPARAQPGWPARAITLVHGLAPGGPSDIIARILAEGLARRLGQQVVVDARPGAGGRVAAGQIARAAPDGYTLMTIPSGHAVSAALYKNLPYRTIDDFSMISLLTEYPFVVVTHADHPIRTLADLISTARSRPAPLLFGSAGNGSLQHLAGELLAKTVNATFQHVPYRGSAQAITDLLAKRIDFIVDSPTAELEFIRAGQVRALAVTGASRFFSLPEIPTTAEAGIPGYTFSSWQGLVAPAGLPAAVVAASTPRSPGSWRSRPWPSGSGWSGMIPALRALTRSGPASPPISTSGPRWSTPPRSSGSDEPD
ncbi:MAG: tripartite tricarboxylate transporter substrate-binding protein [Xanthobacteraceae bacterium]|jgi:tripartite-type tricarboxylate transporter receptor subunit TctC